MNIIKVNELPIIKQNNKNIGDLHLFQHYDKLLITKGNDDLIWDTIVIQMVWLAKLICLLQNQIIESIK